MAERLLFDLGGPDRAEQSRVQTEMVARDRPDLEFVLFEKRDGGVMLLLPEGSKAVPVDGYSFTRIEMAGQMGLSCDNEMLVRVEL